MVNVEAGVLTPKEHERAFRGIEGILDLLYHEKKRVEELTTFTDRKIIFLLEGTGLFHWSFVNALGQVNDSLQQLPEVRSMEEFQDISRSIQQKVRAIETMLRGAYEFINRALAWTHSLLEDEHRIRLGVANYYHQGRVSGLSDEDIAEMARVTELIEHDIKNLSSTLQRLQQLFVLGNGKKGILPQLLALLKQYHPSLGRAREFTITFRQQVRDIAERMNRLKTGVINIERHLASEEHTIENALYVREQYLHQLVGKKIILEERARKTA